MEIYDEEDLSSYEIERQRNIISNYEFMKSCGKFLFLVSYFYTYTINEVHFPENNFF